MSHVQPSCTAEDDTLAVQRRVTKVIVYSAGSRTRGNVKRGGKVRSRQPIYSSVPVICSTRLHIHIKRLGSIVNDKQNLSIDCMVAHVTLFEFVVLIYDPYVALCH
jgi:hypothetical protein